jgi:hypothetical protein
MQTRRLFINGIELQLSERTRIGTTYQANNIGELQNRQGTYTNTFRIRLNDWNTEKLEHANVMTSATIIPYQKHVIDYEEGGIQTLTKAEGIISNSDQDWIFIDAVGGNVSLTRAIGNTTIGELFANDATHLWDFNTVLNSRSSSDYYIYPFIDWRTDETQMFDTPTVEPQKMIACCKATAMIDRIETLTGFNFTGSYLLSADHLNMVITPDDFTQNPDFVPSDEVKATSPILTPSFVEVLQGSGYITPTNIGVTMAVNETGFIAGSYYPATNEVGSLKWTGTLATRQIYINGGLPPFGTPQTGEFWFVAQIKKAGLVIAEYTANHFVGEISDLDSFQNTVINIDTGEIVLDAGIQYFLNIVIYAQKHTNADTQVEFGFVNNQATFTKSPEIALIYGNEIRFTDLFRMKTVDVLKDILNLRGLIIQTNSYTNNVSINYFSDLIKNKAVALDWSHLVDVRQSQLNYKFGDYGQRNNFLFKENENVTEGLGNHYFDINDETLDATKDVVQMAHSATEQKPKYLGNVIPEIEGIETDLNVWKNPGWRILQLDKRPTDFGVNYNDGVTSASVSTDIPFCRFVGFEYLIPENYQALTGILDNAKVLPLVLKLDPIIIHNLDHMIPINLEVPEMYISGTFYLNVITQYQGGLTACEFVRL